MASSSTLPLHLCHVDKFKVIINRSHALLHSIAIAFLIYYRSSVLFQQTKTRTTPIMPWLLVFASELLLSFIWLLGRAYLWRPVSRTVFPERLPKDDKLPPIDVFICTTDPEKEPTVGVMNTLLSAMSLDYPPDKLHVYLSDDGGYAITLRGMKEAWKFAKWWLPFCRKYDIKTRCPEAYFSGNYQEDEHSKSKSSDRFMEERQKIKEKYEFFKESIVRAKEDCKLVGTDTGVHTAYDHPSCIKVIQEHSEEELQEDQIKMPLLVYVSREKRISHSHHFKAGAVNVLLRVSAVLSNSPYILMLDCDMYCNDPTSARQAMCFHLDPQMSSALAFVQFPQTFHDISENDIYDSEVRSAYTILWPGLDGLKGPVLSGTNFYIKREALCTNPIKNGTELRELKNSYGQSNEFIKSLRQDYKPYKLNNDGESSNMLLEETNILSSCSYEDDTKWGKEVGFLYDAVAEDFLTGFVLQCKGWISAYIAPSRPQFLGTSTTNLNDLLIQGTRWGSGLVDVAISRFSPLLYGPPRTSFLHSMCYAELSLFPLLYCLPLWCFATIPQLCLLNGIPLYPEVSDPYFSVFMFIFISSLSKHLHEVLITGRPIQKWMNEQRIWMIKSVACHLYGSLDAVLKKLGMRKASFLTTNKVGDDQQIKLYKEGKFDFRVSTIFLCPLVTIMLLNMASFTGGVARIMVMGDWKKMFGQVLVSLYIIVMNYGIVEGMVVRKDEGRISSSVTLLSVVFALIFLSLGSLAVFVIF